MNEIRAYFRGSGFISLVGHMFVCRISCAQDVVQHIKLCVSSDLPNFTVLTKQGLKTEATWSEKLSWSSIITPPKFPAVLVRVSVS